MNGSIKNLVVERGFGFIVEDQTRNEYFFHRSALQVGIESLKKGDRVTFRIGSSAKGPRAEEVVVVNNGN